MMKKYSILALFFFALLALQCSQQAPVTNDVKANENAIRMADIAWSNEAGQLEGHLGYFLDDAVIMASNEPIISGKTAIGEMLTSMHAMPGFAVKWQPAKVEAAVSGEIGYSMGNYELSMTDSTGVSMTDKGKYLAVWKKQADGSWKVAAESFNSDMPMH